MISARLFRSSLTSCNFLKNLKKLSTAVKNHEDCKNTEKTGHPPLKNLIIEKTVYCLTKRLSGVKLSRQARGAFCSVLVIKEFEKSSYTLRKRRKIEKAKKKNLGCQAGLEPSSCMHAASQLEQQLAGTKTGKVFVSFSPALQRMTLKLAEIPIPLVCNDPWNFRGEFWFSQRENREKHEICCSFSGFALHPTKNTHFFNFWCQIRISRHFWPWHVQKIIFLKNNFNNRKSSLISGHVWTSPLTK